MTYIVYYDKNNNGRITGIVPATAPALENKFDAFSVTDGEAQLFITGKESVAKWFVDFSKIPTLVKKESFVCFQYNESNFFDVEKQLPYKTKIQIIIKNKTIIIKRTEYEHALTFFLTERDNPTFLLEKLIMEPRVDEKTFVVRHTNFSIFSSHGYSSIEVIRK